MIDYLKQKGSQALDAVGASENAREAGEEFLYALPALLHIKLRANREDAILPDTYGRYGRACYIIQQMLEHLGLSSRVKFLVRRLATLWKNKKWNMMSTKWCQFLIRQATFNISIFEWMVSCRIDDFWFTVFDQVIEVVSQIRSQLGLFFPDLELDAEPHSSSTRLRDFLSTISSDTYYRMYYLVLLEPAYRFEGKLMSLIISHIEKYGDYAEEKSIALQEKLLKYA
ncbi:hypothetical protein BKA66DRAFT_479995 [Pyrenochaeta sp. MPI-SDFR-AT-0127]|nr:hypothetical protein BKA66DRAFT_479995 [Pyrenochaeta sp. MPI-SDFR-AT-0127]